MCCCIGQLWHAGGRADLMGLSCYTSLSSVLKRGGQPHEQLIGIRRAMIPGFESTTISLRIAPAPCSIALSTASQLRPTVDFRAGIAWRDSCRLIRQRKGRRHKCSSQLSILFAHRPEMLHEHAFSLLCARQHCSRTARQQKPLPHTRPLQPFQQRPRRQSLRHCRHPCRGLQALSAAVTRGPCKGSSMQH
jgi:hypothetical protein